jgi:hypothetical protein
LLPDEATLALLQAILLSDHQQAKESLLRWQALIPFDDIPYGQLSLMGELASVIDIIDPNYRDRARLMGLKKYVWSNNIRILHPVLPVLDACVQHAITPVLIKGGGVIAADSTHIHRRFIRDLDLLVPESQMVQVSKILVKEGWRPTSGRIPGAIRAQSFDREMTDQQGARYRVEIDLHRSVLHLGRNGDADHAFFSRTLPAQFFGRSVQILHHQDWALVSLMHGGVYSESPNFAWLIDAIRAMRSPSFCADDLVKVLADRSLTTACQPLVKYLADNFGLDLPPLTTPQTLIASFLFDQEAKAIRASRAQRGVWGRLFMWAGEFWRTKQWSHQVTYACDWGVYAQRTFLSLFKTTKITKLTYELCGQLKPNTLIVKIECFGPSSDRSDWDVWHEGGWLTRIRIRSRLKWLGLRGRGSVWSAQIPFEGAFNSGTLRIEKCGE